MKWAYLVLCLAAFAKGELDDLTADAVACSSSLATKTVELISKSVSPVLNDIRTEIRQSREDSNSQIQSALSMLQNITAELSGLVAVTTEINKCGKKPDAPPTCIMLPRNGSPDCKKTYYICDQFANFDSAQAFCQQYGMNHATVETEAIYKYLSPYVIAFRKSLGTWKHGDGFFLAASDVKSPGKWYWTPSYAPFTFSVWGKNEPSGGDEHCLEWRQTGDDTPLSFNDFRCSESRRFICEHKST